MDSHQQLDADFEQASKYLKDLTEVYAHQHDTETIEEIHSLQRQLAGAFQAKQTGVKDTIAGELNGTAGCPLRCSPTPLLCSTPTTG